jgi:5-methylcytosine-specific restriction protein A
MAWERGTAESRGYGWKWKKLRSQILLRDRYLCQVSLKSGLVIPATEVDHIVSKAEWFRRHGNLDRVDDPSNLQAISKEEHEKKTILERGFAVRTGGDVNGLPTSPDHPWNQE